MSQFALYIVGNVLLGVLLLFWLLKNAHSGNPQLRAASDPHQALEWLQHDLLTPEIIARIFAFDDWDFVRSNSTPTVQHSFRRERTQTAVLWLRQTQKQVTQLMTFQRAFASRSHNIEIGRLC